MKNKSIVFLTLMTSLLLNSACHKCVECTEINAVGDKELQWPETCGKKKEIDEYRLFMEGTVNPGNKVKCTERKTTLF
jgi:hypothetical protein